MNSLGFAEDQPIQLGGSLTPYAIHAAYAGDNSFNASAADLSVTITKAATSVTTPTNPQFVPVGGNFSITTTVLTQSSGVAPTGTVTFFIDGNAATGTTTYAGSPGSATGFAFLQATITTSVSASGPHAVTAAYNGNSNYATATTNVAGQVIAQFPTTVTFSASPTTVQFGTPVTGTTVLHTNSKGPTPNGGWTFFFVNGATGPTTVTPITDANGNVGLQATGSFTPNITGTAYAQYCCDPNYSDSTSSSVTITVLPPVFVNVQSSPVTVTRGSSTNATVTLSSLNNFSGTVTVACTIPAGMNEATCTPASQTVNVPNGGQTTATVAIAATAPHTIASLHRSLHWAGFGLLLVGGFLLGIPRKRRSSMLVMLLMLAILAVGLFGCGGGGSSSSTDPRTAPGVYQVGIAVTQNSTTVGSGTVQVTVQ